MVLRHQIQHASRTKGVMKVNKVLLQAFAAAIDAEWAKANAIGCTIHPHELVRINIEISVEPYSLIEY